MARQYHAPEHDQFDPKVFRETLGSFGTTTVPGKNQLTQLQTKARQGVKHVELHLMNSGKGQFNEQDVPDKYGYEQRRTIMQLAKMNQQTLSVHGDFSITSFSGLGRSQGFDETHRANNMKEIDETIKFAAETAKGGAVVFHLHEGAVTTPPGEINLPEKYLEYLKHNRKDEYEKLKQQYLDKDLLDRQFQDNPDLADELKIEYEQMDKERKERLAQEFGVQNWRDYYRHNKIEQIKLEQEGQPYVVVGSSLAKVDRNKDVLNTRILDSYDRELSSKELEFLKQQGVPTDSSQLEIDDVQKIHAIFSSRKPENLGPLSREEFERLRQRFLVRYEDVLEENDWMKSVADKEFFQKNLDWQEKMAELQLRDLDLNYKLHQDSLSQLNDIKEKEREYAQRLEQAQSDEERNRLKEEYQRLNRLKQQLQFYEVGQLEYQKLERYDEMKAQLNEQIRKSREQRENAKALTDEIFQKNASSMGHLGLRALKYQLNLKNHAASAPQTKQQYEKEIADLQQQLASATNQATRNQLNAALMKKRYALKQEVGGSDYGDVDVENRPLYLAPENIMAGYGYMDSLEEYKAVIRSSWDEFAKKLYYGNGEYKQIKEEYERQTGKKISSLDDAKEIAKRHIAGTFDNAHAGVWLKYFNREPGESEEERLQRFNQWMNQEAEDMVKEGIVKHIHFNDTQAKDDDHNLLGSGVLDLHDWRERLRKAGVKEPLIVEAGGRGAEQLMHITNAFDIFNPLLHSDGAAMGEASYRGSAAGMGGDVSDWVSVRRNYEHRPQYSSYGMSYNSFRHQPPERGDQRGGWSGTGFL